VEKLYKTKFIHERGAGSGTYMVFDVQMVYDYTLNLYFKVFIIKVCNYCYTFSLVRPLAYSATGTSLFCFFFLKLLDVLLYA